MSDVLAAMAAAIVQDFTKTGKRFVCAESCTAGLVSSTLAAVPGASAVLWGSFVTYTIDAKCTMLGIDRALISRYGAVSRETALAMARGALRQSGADIAVSVSGLAGPSGDGTDTPVGTVWVARAGAAVEAEAHCRRFEGTRQQIREAAVKAVFELLQ